MPDGVLIQQPMLAPFFDPEKFPYVIAMGATKDQHDRLFGNDYFLLNLKLMSSVVIVKA